MGVRAGGARRPPRWDGTDGSRAGGRRNGGRGYGEAGAGGRRGQRRQSVPSPHRTNRGRPERGARRGGPRRFSRPHRPRHCGDRGHPGTRAGGRRVHREGLRPDAVEASIDTLVAGIDAAWRQGADLVNLSLGTPNRAHAGELRAAADRAGGAGALIVSAGRHEEARYLPGVLDGVVAVELDWTCPRLSVEVGTDADRRPVCRASGYPRPAPGIPPERNLKGLSFAVANVTGVLARTLTGGCRPTADAALAILRARPDGARL